MGQVGIGDRLWITCEPVEEHVAEIDRLAACNEALGCVRRLMKVEVPQRRIDLYLLPWLEARDRHIENHDAAGGFRMKTGKGIRHHSGASCR
jgi:hypothetical protein